MNTPGPWTIEIDHIKGRDETYIATKADGFSWIAKVNDNRNGEANARLIAAAPELLEALESIIAIVERSEPESIHPVTGETIGRRPAAQKIIDTARVAIAKAKAA